MVFISGANAVEFIINHAEVSTAFVQENKIPSVGIHCVNSLYCNVTVTYDHDKLWFSLCFMQILSCLPRCCLHLKSEYKLLTIWSTWNLSGRIWIRIQTTVSFLQLLSALQMFLAHRRRKLKNLGSLAFLGRNFYSWYDFNAVDPLQKSVWIICKVMFDRLFILIYSSLWLGCPPFSRELWIVNFHRKRRPTFPQ